METEAEEENIFCSFSDEEKEQIPSTLCEKLKDVWNLKLREIFSLKVEHERFKSISDEQKFYLEKELEDVRKTLEEEGRSSLEAKHQCKIFEEKVTCLEKELQLENGKVSHLNLEIERLKKEQIAVSTESASVGESLDARSRQLEELKKQVNQLETQLTEALRGKCDAMIQADEAVSRGLHFQYREQRLEQERDLMAKQLKLFQQQLEQRCEESITLRQEKFLENLQLQADLNVKIEEVRMLKEELGCCQEQLTGKQHRIEDLLKSLNDARESEGSLEETYRQELGAQKKVAAIYQNSSENQKSRCDELEKAIEELRQLLQDTSEKYGALEQAKKKSEEESRVALEESREMVVELKDELDKVNKILDVKTPRGNIDDISPTASAVSQLMERGLSLTQLYAEYVRTTEKLMISEEENKRLNRYVDHILQEIEERAPVLRSQREDYEKAMNAVATLQMHTDETLSELQRQRIEAAEAKRKANYLGRENDRIAAVTKDLSRQVTVLLTQLEALRSGLPPPDVEDLEIEIPTSASDVISQHLVAFRNVSELQEQNQKLLESIREISRKAEEAEKSLVEERTQDLKDELELAKAELEELKAGRERQETLVENITSQRDMYRSLLSQQSPKENQTVEPTASADTENHEVTKLQEELESSKKQLNQVRKEQEDYCSERDKNEKLLQEEQDKLRSLLEKARNENIKLLSHAEYNDERIKTLQSSCETYHRQLNAITEKEKTLQGIIGKHEASIEALRNENSSLTKRLATAEVVAANLREEKAILKEAEARLQAERESLQYSRTSQALLLSNLEAIRNNLERTDAEARMRYETQITELTAECSRLKTKIEANSDLKEVEAKLKITEEELHKLHEKHNKSDKELHQTKTELAAAQAHIKEQQEKAKSPVAGPTYVRGRGGYRGHPMYPARFGSPQTAVSVRELQVQLKEEGARVIALKNNLDQAQRSLVEYRQLAENQEKKLKDSSDSHKAAQRQIEDLQKKCNDMQDQLARMQVHLAAANERTLTVQTDLEAQLGKAKDDLAKEQKKHEDGKEEMEKALQQAVEAKQIAEEHTRRFAEVQEKYEREVVLHGADLQVMSTLKEKLAVHDSELEKISNAKLKAEEELAGLKVNIEERENLLRKESKDQQARITEVQEQNKGLLDQFTQLSDKFVNLQTKLMKPSDEGSMASPNVSFSEEETRSADQLREVIKYLRRERDVTAGKCEVAQAEAQRLQVQKKSLEQQVQHLNQTLSEEREKTQIAQVSTGRHAELQRKVETLDAVVDSNKLLRQQKDALDKQVTSQQENIKQLEECLEPLKKNYSEAKIQIDSLMDEKKSLETEREMYKKRTHELVERVNRIKPEDVAKLQQENAQFQKTLQGKEAEITRQKNQIAAIQKNQQRLANMKNSLQAEYTSATEELNRLKEENKRVTQDKTRTHQQLLQTQEKVRMLEAHAQSSQTVQQQELGKLQQRLSELHDREDNLKKEVDESKGEAEEKRREVEALKKENLQLRKIANKYKKAAEGAVGSSSQGIGGENTDEASAASERVKELEGELISLRLQMERGPKQDDVEKLQQELTNREAELEKTKNELLGKESETQQVLASHDEKLQAATNAVNEKSAQLEEVMTKCHVYESRIAHMDKDKKEKDKEIEILNKKLQMQQRQLENLQKQAAAASKPSTTGVSSEKSSSEPPPTANIKPMAASVATVSSPRTQAATQAVAPSRTIPTASIRPLAPPTSGPASSPAVQASSVMVVPPLETHSEGMVSSTVTLPQATVTPTPATPTPTQPTVAATTTLTATVSPTPVSASLSVPSTASFSLQAASASGPQPSSSQSGISAAAVVSVISPQANFPPQPSSSAQVASVSPSTQPTGFAAASSTPVAAVRHQEAQQDDGASSLGTSADALVSQAIALVMPRVEAQSDSQESSQPSRSQKRRLGEEENVVEQEESKRARTEEEVVGPSSSHQEPDVDFHPSKPQDDDDDDDGVILVESDEPVDEDEDDEDSGDELGADEPDNGRDAEPDNGRGGAVGHGDSRRQYISPNQMKRNAQDEGSEADASGEKEAEVRPIHEIRISDDETPETPSESHQPVSEEQSQEHHVHPSAGPSRATSSRQNVPASSTSQSGDIRSPMRHRSLGHSERYGPSSRHSLAPFSQLPQYEEGVDDSIVPSTPTLYVPRRGEGFPEAVSSPQVPTGGFAFTTSAGEGTQPPNTSGLVQMAEGGLIDDTQMDLGQLDEGNKSLPDTQFQHITADLNSESGVSTSGAGPSEASAALAAEPSREQQHLSEEASRDSSGNFTEADSMAVEDDDDDEEESEAEVSNQDGEQKEAGGEHPLERGSSAGEAVALQKESEEAEAEAASKDTHRVGSDVEIERQPGDSSSAVSTSPSATSSPASPSAASSSTQHPHSVRRITPITWDAPSDQSRRSQEVVRGVPRGRMSGRPRISRDAHRGTTGRGTTQGDFQPRPFPAQRARRSRPGSFSHGRS